MKTKSVAGTQWVRPAGCAGRFYPADPIILRSEVESYLDVAPPKLPSTCKALIAPHAGYVYSGPIAGWAYACFKQQRGEVRRVLLLGPSHFADFDGVATSQADAFATPLGDVPVNKELVSAALKNPCVIAHDSAFQNEHSLEVHLPFLQSVLDDFEIVPLLIGEVGDDKAGQLLSSLWTDPNTFVVVSSDLSHYLESDEARKLDRTTAKSIESFSWAALESRQACGCTAIQALLRAAKEKGLKAETLDLRNSGDTAGSKHRVVGYGAFAFF